MKIMIMLLSFFYIQQSFADFPFIVAWQTPCDEIQNALDNYGAVKLKTRFLGLPNTGVVYKEVVCKGEFIRKRTAVFGSKDFYNCHAGYYCESPHGFIKRPASCGQVECE